MSDTQVPPQTQALAFHPLADLFPLIEGEKFDELVADVRTHGVRVAIWLYEGKILDGRNRYRAAQAAGVECPTRVYDGNDPIGFITSLNLKRRDLNASQCAMIAAKLATLRQGARTDLSPIGEKSQAAAAKALNVSKRSVERAKIVREQGGPELIKAVEAGKISVSAAVNSIRPRSPRQKSGISLAETTRRIKLHDELAIIKNTSLDTPTEKDALIELKQLDAPCAAKLVSRAAQGEAVSATAEIDKRKFKPRPDAAKLMELFTRYLLRAWANATPAERRQWLKNLEENADLDILPFLRRKAAA